VRGGGGAMENTASTKGRRPPPAAVSSARAAAIGEKCTCVIRSAADLDVAVAVPVADAEVDVAALLDTRVAVNNPPISAHSAGGHGAETVAHTRIRRSTRSGSRRAWNRRRSSAPRGRSHCCSTARRSPRSIVSAIFFFVRLVDARATHLPRTEREKK
jgi:hypothetical protein